LRRALGSFWQARKTRGERACGGRRRIQTCSGGSLAAPRKLE